MGRTACTESQCLYEGAIYLTFVTFFSAVSIVSIIRLHMQALHCNANY